MRPECLSPPNCKPISILSLSGQLVRNKHNSRSTCSFPWRNPSIPLRFSPPSASLFKANCRERSVGDDEMRNTPSAYDVLGVVLNCSFAELKSSFRAKVKQFHPDVRKGGEGSDTLIRQVIRAYQKNNFIFHYYDKSLHQAERCSYLCVERAPHAFAFATSIGTARTTSQGHGEDYQVQLAVGQCPKSCIHFVTPSQRVILEELLDSILNMPFDTSAEADLLYSLIVKAKFENNCYQKPKKESNVSTERVDWF